MNLMCSMSVVGAFIALLAAPAGAASSGSASVGPLAYELIDLDLTDGVAPWIAFEASGNSEAFARVSTPPFTDERRLTYPTSWTPGIVSVELPSVRAKASLTGSGTLPGSAFSVSASSTDLDAGNSSWYEVSTHSGGSFRASPHTQVNFFAAASVAAVGTGGYPGASLRYNDSTSLVRAWLRLFQGQCGHCELEDDDYLVYSGNTFTGNTTPATPFAFTEERLLSGSWSNRTSGIVYGYVTAEALAAGGTYAGTVDEAQTATLMFAGLMAVFLSVRRKRRT